MKLRPYQQRAADEVRQRLRAGPFRWTLGSPTGSGKTVIMSDLLRDPLRQLVVSHRKIILEQIAAHCKRAGVAFGWRAAGFPSTPEAPIQLAMMQTELRRRHKAPLHDCQLLHIDEIHCQRGPLYGEVFDTYVKAGTSTLGYTATPADLSGVTNGVTEIATVPELIAEGYLCQPRVFCCEQPDLKRLAQLRRDAQGEYLAGDVDKAVKPQMLIGYVIPHLERLSPDGRPFVLFAHSVKASLWWAQSLTFKGFPTAHICANDVWMDGKSYSNDPEARNACFDRLRDGSLRGVSNRFVLREGWDCPIVGHVINTAPVGTRKTWVQMCGRVLRPYEGREFAMIQDHSGSAINFPALDSDEPWDWESPPGLYEKIRLARMRAAAEREERGEQQEDDIPEPIVCPECMGMRMAGDTCPFCGHRYEKRSRYVIQLDGTLKLQTGRAFKPRRIRPKPGDAKVWERRYWAAVKNSTRTCEQVYAYHAMMNNWNWLPRNLPLMPRDQADWFIPLKDVPSSRLLP